MVAELVSILLSINVCAQFALRPARTPPLCCTAAGAATALARSEVCTALGSTGSMGVSQSRLWCCWRVLPAGFVEGPIQGMPLCRMHAVLPGSPLAAVVGIGHAGAECQAGECGARERNRGTERAQGGCDHLHQHGRAWCVDAGADVLCTRDVHLVWKQA